MSNTRDKSFTVSAYTLSLSTHKFFAKTRDEAMEIAKRIVTEGLWIMRDEGEVLYPVHQVYKVEVRESRDSDFPFTKAFDQILNGGA